MNRLLRLAGGVIGVLLVVLLLAVGATAAWYAWFLDMDVHRERLLHEVERYTGRVLRVDGEASLTLIPRIGLEAGPVSLVPRDGFGDEPMIRAERVSVFLQPWPLLRGEVRLKRIALDTPRVSIGIDADGRSAWADIIDQVRAETGWTQVVGDVEALGAALAALAAQGLSVRDGEVHWADARDGTVQAITGLSLEADRLRSGKNGRFELAGRIESAHLVHPVHVSASTNVSVDFETFDSDIADLRVAAGSEDFDASFSVTKIAVRRVNGTAFTKAADLSLAVTRGDLSLDAVAPAANFDGGADTISIRRVDVDGPGLALRASAELTNLSGVPSMRLSARSSAVDAAPLLEGLGFSDRLGGRGSLSADLETTGDDPDALISNLDGFVDFELVDGVFRGIDIGRILAAARGDDAAAAPSDGVPATRIARAGGRIRFDSGVGRFEALEGIAEGFTVNGEGVLDLVRSRVDIRLAIVAARTQQAVNGSAKASTPVPLRMHGRLDAPRFEIDFDALMRAGER